MKDINIRAFKNLRVYNWIGCLFRESVSKNLESKYLPFQIK